MFGIQANKQLIKQRYLSNNEMSWEQRVFLEKFVTPLEVVIYHFFCGNSLQISKLFLEPDVPTAVLRIWSIFFWIQIRYLVLRYVFYVWQNHLKSKIKKYLDETVF